VPAISWPAVDHVVSRTTFALTLGTIDPFPSTATFCLKCRSSAYSPSPYYGPSTDSGPIHVSVAAECSSLTSVYLRSLVHLASIRIGARLVLTAK